MAMVKATGTGRYLLSKIAMSDGHGENSAYFDGWKAYEMDPFHPTKNPSGIIQMGLAENQLSFDLVEEWIKKNPKASICTVEGVEKFKDTANFQDYHGLPEFRNAVANFMKKTRGKVNIDPDRIVMSGGATGAHELVAFCLADPGEAFLVPSPYYSGFARDLRWRTGVQLLPVICESSNDFQITRKALEEAYERAQEDNITVKGVLITNPSNPLGTLLDKETLKSIVSFINQKNIHLVCDEIYAATVFTKPRFISIAEVIEEDDVVCNRDLIHIVYSLSKDLGFPGFRVGIVYSYNDMVMKCARKMSSFGLVSSQTQHLLACMLSDDEFVDNFLVENPKRLLKRYKLLTWGLSQVGIRCLKSNAGLYCWMDLRPLLKEPTEESELELWRTIVHDVKLNVSPGSSFHCTEPGWFRVCFANMDDDTLMVTLTRMRTFMFQDHEVVVPAKTRRFQSPDLRLSFSSMRHRFEDASLSPIPCMSPRSPLVKATT